MCFFVENHFNRFKPLFLFVCLFRQSTTFDYNSAPIDSNYKNYDSEYPYKVSSYWCVVLRNQAANPKTGIKELFTCEDILMKANRGYVVVVAWENTSEGRGGARYCQMLWIEVWIGKGLSDFLQHTIFKFHVLGHKVKLFKAFQSSPTFFCLPTEFKSHGFCGLCRSVALC